MSPTGLSRQLQLLPALLVAGSALADTEVTLDELLRGWGSDLTQAEVTVETLQPGLHVLRAAGGAVIASIGDDGVLLVDDQYAQTVDDLQAAVRDLGGRDVDFVINTHAHFDHANGNPVLGAAGAHIVAHHNARAMLMRSSRLDYGDRYYVQPPSPSEGLPVVTFDEGIVLHVNGQTIDVAHFGPAHTDGDVIAHFREANVVHVGDLYVAPWPYIDAGNGGSLSGLIATCNAILDRIDDDTRVVSGHRPTTDRAGFETYTRRLEAVYARLAGHAAAGRSVEEMIAADPTAGLDDSGANPTLFLTLAYPTVVADQ
ncbi:MAG: MBL fold metallo-hydrolase [Woeseiaceae bacterium]|nr:MBL fold metallo-hydrolase [Woeseiaceae bacterium]